jgi:hypothetical protein
MPYTYVSPTSTLFSRGRSTPAMRAIPLALPLLVPRVLADYPQNPTPAYYLALITDRFDTSSHFQTLLLLLFYLNL